MEWGPGWKGIPEINFQKWPISKTSWALTYYKRISLLAMIPYFLPLGMRPSVNNLGYLLFNGFTLLSCLQLKWGESETYIFEYIMYIKLIEREEYHVDMLVYMYIIECIEQNVYA